MKTNYDPKIHHRRSIRLKGYDYSQSGLYFITICCQYRACLFGKITVGANRIRPEMILNEFGQIAHDEWLKTLEIRNNVKLGAFVVMPNHIHGIIEITRRGELHSPLELHSPNESHSPIESHSPNESHSPIDSHSPNKWGDLIIKGECNSPLRGPSNTIGAIVRGYKSSVTKQLNLLNIGCVVWQRNYYEHIIRDEKSYHNISNYILNNPAKWAEDKFSAK